MKKLFITLLAACALTSAKADEGMWTLYNLPNAVYETMKQENYQLPYLVWLFLLMDSYLPTTIAVSRLSVVILL